MGPIGVKKHLAPYLPSHPVVCIMVCSRYRKEVTTLDFPFCMSVDGWSSLAFTGLY